MRLLAIALALLLTAPAFADEPDAGTRLVYDCPPADAPVRIDGGYIISDALERRLTCVLAAAEAHRDLLLAQKTWTPNYNVSQVIGLACMVAGAVLTYFVVPELKRMAGVPP